MCRRVFLVGVLVLFAASGANGSGGTDSFVNLDLVRFFPKGESAILEGYVQIAISAIELEDGPGSKANIEFQLTLEDSEKKVVYQNNWKFDDMITEEMLADGSNPLIQSFALLMNPGTYTLKLDVAGVKDGVRHEFERQIEAPKGRPLLSDILLANRIEVDTTKMITEHYDTYVKDGLLIFPNPCAKFVGATSLVYFYCQVQNQDTAASKVHMQLEIIDSDENLVKKLPDKDLKLMGRSRVYVGAFSTGGLKEGNYILRAVATQTNSTGEELIDRRDKPFSVTAKRTILASMGHINEYSEFDETQLDSIFRLMRYLVTNKNKEYFKSLSIVGKRNFLHEFWKQHDPVPATPENEFRIEFQKRLEYANRTFSMGWDADAIEGWLTDRGRIYALHGEPDERIKRPNEYGSPPWELWKFFSSGYSYLFIDRNDNELYDLVFTNDKDEPIMPGWERYFPDRVLSDIYTELGYTR